MNLRSALLIVLGLFAIAVVAQADPNGPNLVHYSVDEVMTPTGVDADATGRVRAFVREKGDTGLERLRLQVAGLDPRAPYVLLAKVGDATDFAEVATFTTTAAGKGNVFYLQNHRSKNPGRRALPEMLGSLPGVSALAVANTNGQVILSVNLHESPSMSFQLASVFSNVGSDPKAIGCVAVLFENGVVQFRLLAAGDSSAFTFCVNDVPLATYDANGAGFVNVGMLPQAAPSPMKFRNLSVRDDADEVVLQSSPQP